MADWKVSPVDLADVGWLGEWDVLNRRLNRSHPMLDSRFVQALLRHFGSQGVMLCRQSGATGFALVCRHRRGMWTTHLPAQAQIGPILLEDWGAIPDLIQALPGHAFSLDLLSLDSEYGFPEESVRAAGLSTLMDHDLTMNIDLSGSFESYWEGRSRKLIQNMRRYAKRWENDGMTRLVRITERDAMAAAVRRYGELESAGWKGRAGTAVHADNVQGRFYTDVMERFAATGNALVYEYWRGDALAAARLAITSSDMILMLKTAYDEKLSELAPGRLLLHDLLKLEFQRREHGRIEFYTNATQDQLAWATGERRIRHATFYRGALSRGLVGLIRRAKVLLRGQGRDEETGKS
jgi:hypothetical protein